MTRLCLGTENTKAKVFQYIDGYRRFLKKKKSNGMEATRKYARSKSCADLKEESKNCRTQLKLKLAIERGTEKGLIAQFESDQWDLPR